MNFKYGVVDSSYKQIKYDKNIHNHLKENNFNMSVVKNEKFAFQVLINCQEEALCSLGKVNYISWRGLQDKLRLDIEGEFKDIFSMSFIGYVRDDKGTLTADPILREKSIQLEGGVWQSIWIEGKIPCDFHKENITLKIPVYNSKAYEAENNIATIEVNIKVRDLVMPEIKDSGFYLDLWQHPSNWARQYKVELWSEEHFYIIDNYIKELASMGEKVITIIASDYPWAGQGCYKVQKNASNLFEYNMVSVKKSFQGNIECDFSNTDRYIELCSKYGIDKEIDIFGLLGNWDNFSFGNPIKDYKDPIRISYYDEKDSSFKFIDNKKDFGEYLKVLFQHLIKKGYWDKIRIMSDEPDNCELFEEWTSFLSEAASGHELKYKCAVHNEEFLDKCIDKVDELSLSAAEVVNNINDIENIKSKLSPNGGKLTWYVCCFPERPNNFIESPLIESRLIGWFTYYFRLDGFLRWDYAIWTNDPWDEISYKYPSWTAGDMFFVYPGKDMKPVSSIRWENLRFGIQDYIIFKELCKSGLLREEIERDLSKPLGKKDNMKKFDTVQVDMKYSLSHEEYMIIREKLISKCTSI